MTSQISVVIRSKDEADRLRLTLRSLACQTVRPQVVVVNDGSSDHTPDVIAEAAGDLDLVQVHHAMPAGRSAAANAGVEKAQGQVVLFLDGDTLAAPDLVALHELAHREGDNLIVRGETWHLRCTRQFLDPESGSPRPGEEAGVARMSAAELARSLVTRQQITNDFGVIDRRAQPGIYPGYGPRKLFELEMQALTSSPDCGVLWAAASGSNQSLRRCSFIEAGGFHPDLSINEHRELALRLSLRGGRMVGTKAKTYHMIHRSGWRDPLHEKHWEEVFFQAHPTAQVALMSVLWASIGEPSLPQSAQIRSLPELEQAAARVVGLSDCDGIRRAHLQRAGLK